MTTRLGGHRAGTLRRADSALPRAGRKLPTPTDRRSATTRALLYYPSPKARRSIAQQSTGVAEVALARPPPREQPAEPKGRCIFHGVHHVGLLVDDLERSLHFYCDVLGLELNNDRPNNKLPYRGAWLWIGPEMIHLMELPSPDPVNGRPEHGGRDRHVCVGIHDLAPLEDRLKAANITYTRSVSGRAALFFRDPDMNVLECAELPPWR